MAKRILLDPEKHIVVYALRKEDVDRILGKKIKYKEFFELKQKIDNSGIHDEIDQMVGEQFFSIKKTENSVEEIKKETINDVKENKDVEVQEEKPKKKRKVQDDKTI